MGMEDWLLDRGSLTSRLVKASEGAFRVRVVHQGWGRPLYSESQLLNTRRAETALVREVELLGHDTPWVFARTLIPASSLRGSARRLANLGEKPLGAVLFFRRQHAAWPHSDCQAATAPSPVCCCYQPFRTKAG